MLRQNEKIRQYSGAPHSTQFAKREPMNVHPFRTAKRAHLSHTWPRIQKIDLFVWSFGALLVASVTLAVLNAVGV